MGTQSVDNTEILIAGPFAVGKLTPGVAVTVYMPTTAARSSRIR